MNKSLIYTNVILTVITALLAVMVLRPNPTSAVAGPMEVKVVDVAKNLPVTVDFGELRKTPLAVSLGTSPLPVTLGAGPLPVTLGSAPLPVKIEGAPLAVTLGKMPLPVTFGQIPLPVSISEVRQNLPVVVMASAPVEVKVVNADDRPVRLSGPVDVNIVQVAGDRVPQYNSGRLEVKVGSN